MPEQDNLNEQLPRRGPARLGFAMLVAAGVALPMVKAAEVYAHVPESVTPPAQVATIGLLVGAIAVLGRAYRR